MGGFASWTPATGTGAQGPGLGSWAAGNEGCSVQEGGRHSGGWRGAGPPAPSPAPRLLALPPARVAVGVAPQAHTAALLHLRVAKGAAGAVRTAQRHVARRGPQLLAAAAPVLNHVGFQRVPVGEAAQHQGPRRPSPPQTPAKTHRWTALSQPQAHVPIGWRKYPCGGSQGWGGAHTGPHRLQVAKGATESRAPVDRGACFQTGQGPGSLPTGGPLLAPAPLQAA